MKHEHPLSAYTMLTLFVAGIGLLPSCAAETAAEDAETTAEVSAALSSLSNEIRSKLDQSYCLDVANGSTANGTGVRLWSCNGSMAQKWTFTAAGELRSGLGPNLCLDVVNGGTTNGTPVQLWSCNGSNGQKWAYTGQQTLKSSVAAGKCLDVSGGALQDGTIAKISSCNTVQAQKWTAPTGQRKWMAALSDLIGNKPLNQVVLPGTHDSGTYSLLSGVAAPDADNAIVVQYGSLVGVTEGWAKAQQRDITQQLEDGIRALDLRPCIDAGGTARICHGLYGPELQGMLMDVADFAASHPKEIVLLWLTNYSQAGLGKTMSAANVDLVHQMVKTTLADVLVDVDTVSPTTTVNSLWTNQPGRTVIVLSDHWDADFWSTSAQASGSWNDTWYIEEKKGHMDQRLEATKNEGRLFSLSGAATPDINAIGLGLAPFVPGQVFPYPTDLRTMAAAVNPVMLSWLLHDWALPDGPQSPPSAAMRVNIVGGDYYDESCLLPVVWKLNGDVNQSLEGCDIVSSQWDAAAGSWTTGDSVWATWRAARPCPPAFTDAGAYCTKPPPYDRGVGYPWQFGDPLDDSGMFSRCEADHGPGNCEKYDLVVYPRCAAGYHAFGCCICTPDCPSGMTDIGISCQK